MRNMSTLQVYTSMKGRSVEAGRPYLRADWLSLLWGVELVPTVAVGRGKLLRGVLGVDDHNPLMVGLM